MADRRPEHDPNAIVERYGDELQPVIGRLLDAGDVNGAQAVEAFQRATVARQRRKPGPRAVEWVRVAVDYAVLLASHVESFGRRGDKLILRVPTYERENALRQVMERHGLESRDGTIQGLMKAKKELRGQLHSDEEPFVLKALGQLPHRDYS